MLRYRKLLVAVIDLIMVGYLIYAACEFGDGDFFGIFLFYTIGFIIIYNLYALLVYFSFRLIKPRKIAIEACYFLLMLIPFYILYRYTNK